MDKDYGHIPVLLEEALDGLAPRADGVYVDATFGRGGHARALLARVGPGARVTVFDRDVQAIRVAEDLAARDARVTVVHDNYSALGERLPEGCADGVLFDLGISSPQIDDAERGMSFSRDGPLDMRMDQGQGLDASGWLAQVEAGELERVLRDYGDERRAKALARAIVDARQQTPLTRTGQLADLCWKVIGKHEDKHPATRTFQAIRIHINDELGGIRRGLEGALRVLKTGGRLAVIAFHSLEDRIVKQYFNELSKPPAADRRLPPQPFTARLKLVGKAQFAASAELIGNPRARSAVLRVAEKLA